MRPTTTVTHTHTDLFHVGPAGRIIAHDLRRCAAFDVSLRDGGRRT